MPFASASPTLTVSVLLKQPELLSRELVNLVNKRLITDRICVHGSAGQVAGGAMRYQELESIYTDDSPVEVAEGADFPLTDWSETAKTAPVRQFGFAVRVTNLAIRRNQRDMVDRGMRKLANQLVKYIDTQALAELQNTTKYTGIQTDSTSASWGTVGTDIIADIGKFQEKLETKDNGYSGFSGATLILNTGHRDALLNNTGLRAALPRETQTGQIQSGMVAPFLGLKEILFTPQIVSGTALLLDTDVAATIADEQADPSEGWVSYDPGPGFQPIYVKVEDDGKPAVHKRVSAGRWPAIAVVQPDAIVKITGL